MIVDCTRELTVLYVEHQRLEIRTKHGGAGEKSRSLILPCKRKVFAMYYTVKPLDRGRSGSDVFSLVLSFLEGQEVKVLHNF